jgi:hypothetical protein
MLRRLFPVGLVIAAAFLDRAGARGLAFDAVLLAVPLTAVGGLAAFGEHLEKGVARTQAFFWAAALLLVVIGAAARAPAVAEGVVPPLAEAALVGCLAVFCAQALASVFAELERERARGALGHVDQRLDREERADGYDESSDYGGLEQALGGR